MASSVAGNDSEGTTTEVWSWGWSPSIARQIDASRVWGSKASEARGSRCGAGCWGWVIGEIRVVAAGGYDPARETAEDLDLWLRLAETGQLASLPDVLVKYRVHQNSVSSQHAAQQIDCIREICAAARARRGVEAPFDCKPWRMEDSRASRRDFALKYGWDAWNWGYRDTWRHYALKAVTTDPFSVKAWKLLIFGALRRPPPGKYVLEGS